MLNELWKRARFGLFILGIGVLSFSAVVILFSVAESLWRGR